MLFTGTRAGTRGRCRPEPRCHAAWVATGAAGARLLHAAASITLPGAGGSSSSGSAGTEFSDTGAGAATARPHDQSKGQNKVFVTALALSSLEVSQSPRVRLSEQRYGCNAILGAWLARGIPGWRLRLYHDGPRAPRQERILELLARLDAELVRVSPLEALRDTASRCRNKRYRQQPLDSAAFWRFQAVDDPDTAGFWLVDVDDLNDLEEIARFHAEVDQAFTASLSSNTSNSLVVNEWRPFSWWQRNIFFRKAFPFICVGFRALGLGLYPLAP